MEKASKSGLLGKIFSWIGAIVGLIAAVAAVIATGGALAAVGLGLAVLAIGMLVMEETGGMDKMMTAMFGDNEKAKMIFQIALMAIMLVASLATMGTGVAQAAGKLGQFGAKMAEVATGISKMASESVKLAAKATSIGAGIVTALSAIGGGSAKIASSVQSKEVADTQAKSKELEAWIAKLQTLLQDNQDELEKAMEELMNGNAMIVDMLKSIDQSKGAIAQHMGA
jgi:hypothetical protein